MAMASVFAAIVCAFLAIGLAAITISVTQEPGWLLVAGAFLSLVVLAVSAFAVVSFRFHLRPPPLDETPQDSADGVGEAIPGRT